MNGPALSQALNSSWVIGGGGDSHSCKRFQESCVGSLSVGLVADTRFYVGKINRFRICRSYVSRSSKSCAACRHPILSSFGSHSHGYQTADKESTLILMRHGESMWNEKNLFTGCVDVPLTSKGVKEAIEAGKRVSNLPLDIVYTSALIRAQMTTMLALTQHHCMKFISPEPTVESVVLLYHLQTTTLLMRKNVVVSCQHPSLYVYVGKKLKRQEAMKRLYRSLFLICKARIWSQIYSEGTKKQSIPVVKAWQLNERMYGELQGLNKQETAEQYGKEQVHNWRRSYHVRPPNGESLEMCLGRAVTFFKEHVINLELSTGVPMLYIYREGNFIRRGSPVGSSEAGVYAFTEV
ncbi:UNVERIFIED_CONTAM: 2,3-bisphosphoglycerate-dependent phosphoglycerate mutase [Sesamum radiatum]|uniref:phosphoglycerate mutase (2,3-diphosphoglycerate-dependent) n=1 Tax=Sesamum radiatum TaxID=300843 RepID=A0AAW2RE84_SESRA